MHREVPQWLPQAFVRSAVAAGATAPKEQIVDACSALLAEWSSSDRHYHTVQHLIDTVSRVETLAPEMHNPDLVRLAAWYHGVVFSTEDRHTYTRNGGEDEAASSEFAREDLRALGLPEANVERVACLIRGIRPRRSDGPADETTRIDAIDIDLQALRDAHLGPLAADPQRYASYLGSVRKEYCHIPFIDYLNARQEIVKRLLARPQLFITPLARQWEEPTRQNLEAELKRLAAKAEALRSGAECAPSPERDALAARVPDDDAAPRTSTTVRVIAGDAPAAAGQPATDTLSSLETCADRFVPGEREREDLSADQIKKRKREKLAAEVRRRIEERQAAPVTKKILRARGGDEAPTPEGLAVAQAEPAPAGQHQVEEHAGARVISQPEEQAARSADAKERTAPAQSDSQPEATPPEPLSGIEREPDV